jgi:hypothetical protein
MPARFERKMQKLDKRSDAAWDSAMEGLGEARKDEPGGSADAEAPAAAAAPPPAIVDGDLEVWTVLQDRTLRQYPQESSAKTGTIRSGMEVVLLETAQDGRGKQRLRVRASTGEGWVSKDTGKGRVAMVLNRKASSARPAVADLRTLLDQQQQQQQQAHSPQLETAHTALTSESARPALTTRSRRCSFLRCCCCCCCCGRRHADGSDAAP